MGGATGDIEVLVQRRSTLLWRIPLLILISVGSGFAAASGEKAGNVSPEMMWFPAALFAAVAVVFAFWSVVPNRLELHDDELVIASWPRRTRVTRREVDSFVLVDAAAGVRVPAVTWLLHGEDEPPKRRPRLTGGFGGLGVEALFNRLEGWRSESR